MSRKIIDIHNQRFGSLVALLPVKRIDLRGRVRHFWLCRCDCGNMLTVRSDNLRSGHTQACSRCGDGRFGQQSNFVKGRKIR